MNKHMWVLAVVLVFAMTSCASNSQNSQPNPIKTSVEQPAEPTNQTGSKGANNDSKPANKPKSESSSASESNLNEPGSYLTLQEYERAKDRYLNSEVVLFFNANWCSTCKIARDNIESNLDSIPSNLAIVVVDFDKETDLRKKYGVTIQHTFVQIDKDGNEIAKWSGSVTAEEIAEETI